MAAKDSNGRVKITQSFLNGIKATGRREKYHDSTVPGLLLRVGPDAVSRVWYLDYRNHDGKRQTYRIGSNLQFSIEAAKREARKQLGYIADGIDPAALKKQKRLDSAKADSRTLMAYLHGAYWDQHLKHARSGEATRKRIQSAWQPMLNTDMSTLSADKLIQHRSHRRSSGVSVATLNRDRTALMALLNHAVEAELLKANPVARFKKIKEPKHERVRFLEPDERKRFMKALQAEPDYFQVLVQLALLTGMRRGEMFQLKWPQVNLRRKELTVLAATAKADSTRIIPLPLPAVDMLQDWKASQALTDIQQHVFLNPSTRKPFSDVKRRWQSLISAAEVDDFRLHDCRHDYATRLVEAGIDLYRVKELLGHSSIEQTQRYAHIKPETLKSAVEVLA